MNKHSMYKNLMSGISQMLPFMVAGSLLLWFSLFLNTYQDIAWLQTVSIWFNDVGTLVFNLIFLVLAAFIAYAISDKPGFVLGLVAGALALLGSSGMIGAIIGGFIAGYIIVVLKKLFSKLPISFYGIKAILFIPVIGVLIILVMMLGINIVIAPVTAWISTFFDTLDGVWAIIIGLLLGGLMTVDMGGPINKAIYVIGLLSVSSGQATTVMASIMVGGMTPSLSTALVSLLFKNKLSQTQIDISKKNWILGLSFITEGALLFAKENPKKIIPSLIIGSAIAGGVTALFHITTAIPHGGIFIIFAMSNWWGFLIALAIGTIISALLMGILLPKQNQSLNTEEAA